MIIQIWSIILKYRLQSSMFRMISFFCNFVYKYVYIEKNIKSSVLSLGNEIMEKHFLFIYLFSAVSWIINLIFLMF